MNKSAAGKIIIDNVRTRVTEWRFTPGSETGWHRHEYDYLIVPMLSGKLRLETAENSETLADLQKGTPYFREAGIEHNVINANHFDFSFIEVEFK